MVGNYFVNFKRHIKINKGGGYSSLEPSSSRTKNIPGVATKRIVLLCLLLFTLIPLFSSSLNWIWENSDENIKYYRYKTALEDEWTIVDSSITSVTTDSSSKNLYLQASFDGVNWSDTSVGTWREKNEDGDIGFVSVSWTNDKDYSYFRYQRDSESEDGWTIIDGRAESIELPYHKGLNTYYIQSSFDGINWSESASCTYLDKHCTCDSLLWRWTSNDSAVKYFRYQLDGDGRDGWTVVGSSIRETELPAHEGLNRLYVETSYDGETWSEATVGTYIYEAEKYRTRRWETTVSLLPYAYQKISYTIPNTITERSSVYGGGAGVEIRYNFTPVLSIGSALTSEHYKYESFHVYHDFKLTATLGVEIIGSESSRNKIYMTLGGGMDFVVRDDNELGCYPLLSYGVKDTFNITDRIALGLSVALNHTFLNGTSVFNIIPSISLTYTWGCKAGCPGCKGGCR